MGDVNWGGGKGNGLKGRVFCYCEADAVSAWVGHALS